MGRKNGSVEHEEIIDPTNRRKGRLTKIPPEIGEVMAVAAEDGARVADIAELFGVSPGAVRLAIHRVPEEELRAIRRLFSVRSWVMSQRILDACQEETLRRIADGELSRKVEGHYVIGLGDLQRMAKGVLEDREVLSAGSGMVGGGEAARSSIGQLLATVEELDGALRVLPKGSRVKVSVQAEVESGGGPPAALEASSEVLPD